LRRIKRADLARHNKPALDRWVAQRLPNQRRFTEVT
jgi:hypothetical protein